MGLARLEQELVEHGLDAERLCLLLGGLDARSLTPARTVLPSNGPQVVPLFRGANAELLLVRWSTGQAGPVCDLGDAAMAVRPLEGAIELLGFRELGRQRAELERVTVVGPDELAGIPAGAIHGLRAPGPATTLHLCAPPVIWRTHFQVAWR